MTMLRKNTAISVLGLYSTNKFLIFWWLTEVLNAMLVLYSNDFAETLIPIIHASHQHWNKTSPPGWCVCNKSLFRWVYWSLQYRSKVIYYLASFSCTTRISLHENRWSINVWHNALTICDPVGWPPGEMHSFGISFFPAGEESCLILETISVGHGDIPIEFVRVLVDGMSL